jgi:hypothetical protein
MTPATTPLRLRRSCPASTAATISRPADGVQPKFARPRYRTATGMKKCAAFLGGALTDFWFPKRGVGVCAPACARSRGALYNEAWCSVTPQGRQMTLHGLRAKRTTKAGTISTTLVEAYCDKQGRPHQRVLANLHGKPTALAAVPSSQSWPSATWLTSRPLLRGTSRRTSLTVH